MDEQTFRRMAPDAVAGRLDGATYERWKAAAGEDPARATFVLRIAEADARLSARHSAPAAPFIAPPPRVSRKRFLSMAAIFAVLGLLAGAMTMQSYLKSQNLEAAPGANSLLANAPPETPQPDSNNLPAGKPAVNQPAPEPAQPDPEPEPDPDPDPQPEPPVDDSALLLISAAESVSVRGERDTEWRRLAPGEALPDEATVSSRGAVRLRSAHIEIFAAGPVQFERVAGVIRFSAGRAAVRVNARHVFSCYKQEWSVQQGSFVVDPRRLGGDLYVLEGSAMLGAHETSAPTHVQLDGTRREAALSGTRINQLELELIGPHRRLLYWDCETESTRPELGELVQPGAFNEGHGAQRKPGQPGIGVAASSEVFKAEPNARLRMRIKTTAASLRIEMRVKLETGFRVVDAHVSLRGNDSWQVIDVALDVLRAGRFRAEPGWLAGRVYSAFIVAPGADPEAPLARHELVIDDVIVYVPES